MELIPRLHILTGDKSILPFVNDIQKAVDEVLLLVVDKLRISDVDIVVVVNPSGAIPETDVGGITHSPHLIMISIDPQHENLQRTIYDEIKSTITHEMHHAARNRFHPWPGTLLDDFISEGLADHFDIEINKTEPKPWSIALNEQDLAKCFEIAGKDFQSQNSESSYTSWMFGSEELGIPRWAGYSLGFKIVGDYLAKTGKKASELVETPSTVFIE